MTKNNIKDFVSVILPVYNGDEHLTECIESVLSQTYDNFEFIIVDDASTDNTPQILKEFAMRDNRIKVITHAVNQKQTAAANTACQNAGGKYIARMDADDIALPHRFKEQVEFMEKNPDIGILGSWIHIIDNNGKIHEIMKTNISQGSLGWSLIFDVSFISSSVMMRKDIIEQVGFYQTHQAEDYDLWSRVNTIASVANLPKVLQQVRVWSGQVSHTVPRETRNCTLQIMKKNMQLLLNDSSIDLKLVEVIRSITENNQPELESDLLVKASSLIKALYNTYISKTDLSKEEKKIVDVDAFQKLYKLANWQFSANIFKAIIENLYLACRFPKLLIYSLVYC